MIEINDVHYQIQAFVHHIMQMDKETLIQCIYPFWLYILMDGATRMGSSRRKSYARHH